MGNFILGCLVGWLVGLATGYMNNTIYKNKQIIKKLKEENDKEKHDPR